ncbi:sensor histidine kinase [Streptomyces sp. GQFP]|uniref:sensor histidine kinase n=1 Tax=Streptomyces sp. GQFP TaxID=2907545 RepID=UPI001F1FE2B0|nr:sensor histidine kinase [Streptomyces sp. GQFP]UIX29396.1 sensor histidine kinase [Streptomyces sp. GQFP]
MSGRRGKSSGRAPGRTRGRSIRGSLIALALVPALALVVLWASGSAVLLNQWRSADNAAETSKTAFALMPVMAELQKERQQTVAELASDGSRSALDTQRRRTDAALATFRKADDIGKSGSAEFLAKLADVRERLAGLTAERTAIDDGKKTRQQAYADYSTTVLSMLNLFGIMSSNDGDVATQAYRALVFIRGLEALTQEGAVLAGVAASERLSTKERADLTAATAVRDYTFTNQVMPYLPANHQAALKKIFAGPDWAALTAFEAAIPVSSKADDGTITVSRVPAAAVAAPARAATAVQGVQFQYLADIQKQGEANDDTLLDRVLLGSSLALAAVLAIAVMSLRITRSLIGRMSSLRRETLELARDRLPELVTRLRTEGSRADLDELPELDYGSDELGKVADAFNAAQRTAVAVALEQAEMREGTRLVFLNMSRRTQVLVHRQLTVIDGMERREQDPELLADLYTVDHLATRMRRNAESLTVLSGAIPRRRWKQAVPLEDVLRSAVSEIEGYARVVVEPMPPIAVTGPAVGDTIHLMAELIENGVAFSPPHTEVRVRALPVAQGIAVEVEDRGLGLSEQEYATANDLLHNPPDFSFSTLGDDPRLGLFTVSHLAQRHGFTVTLRPSSYGGSMAVVVLPQALTEPVVRPAPMPLDSRADRHLAPVESSPPAGVTPSGMPKRVRTVPHAAPAPVPAPAPTAQAPAPAPSSSGPRSPVTGRLPRRVRQTHLAPQLLEKYADPQHGHDTGQNADERRPEHARSMLAALRDGTQRARAEAEVPHHDWSATPPDEQRPLLTRPRPTRNTP